MTKIYGMCYGYAEKCVLKCHFRINFEKDPVCLSFGKAYNYNCAFKFEIYSQT